MKKSALALLMFLAPVGATHAATIYSQSTEATTTAFYPNSTVFTLGNFSGVLKSFDLYLSASHTNFVTNNVNSAIVPGAYITFAGCDTSGYAQVFTSNSTNPAVPMGDPFPSEPSLVTFMLASPLHVSGACTMQIELTDGFSNVAGAYSFASKVVNSDTAHPYFVAYNTFGTPPSVSHVSIVSDNASTTYAKAGNNIKLSFDVDRPVRTPDITIAGRPVAAATTTGNSFEANTTLLTTDPEGPLTFTIAVQNLLGDDGFVTSTTTNTAVFADHTGPTLGADSRITNEATPLIGGMATDTASGIASVGVSVAGTPYTPVVDSNSWSVTLPNLPEGTYPIAVVATDKAGNQSSANATLTIDRTAPVVSITSGPADNSFTNQTSATFGFTANAPTVCSIDGGASAPCSSTYATGVLSSGTHLFSVSASDEAGNTTTRTRSWSIDTTAPILREVAIATSTADTTPTYVFSSSKAGTITYGGACSSATTAAVQGDNTITFNTLAIGTYSNCTIVVSDAFGNTSAPLLISTFTITPAPAPRFPRDKDECKNNRWRTFVDPQFKNQGDCVSFTVSNKYKDDRH